jgi:L-amino acid N-acyltransferase YncA
MKTSCTLRLATEADLPAINHIYNHYVLHSTCTYQETPESIEDRLSWFRKHDEKHPVVVAVADEQVQGWGSLSVFRERSAYRNSVENSIYLHHDFRQQGIGSLILEDLIHRARLLGHHAIIAGMDGEQPGSFALHAKFGFEKVAHFKEVGFKFGRWLDVIYTELIL